MHIKNSILSVSLSPGGTGHVQSKKLYHRMYFRNVRGIVNSQLKNGVVRQQVMAIF